MTYSLTIVRHQSDPTYNNGITYINDIKKWDEVLDYLRNKLDQWTIGVHIYKWSSNSRCLGEKYVTMGNICDVVWNGTDKVLL